MTEDERYDRGLQIRKEVMGAANIEQRLASDSEFMRPLHNMISSWAYGEVWAREGLSRSVRSLLVIAMMAATGRPHELRAHLMGALNNGCTQGEIQEVLLQVAVYCGFPASLDAHRIAEQVFRDHA